MKRTLYLFSILACLVLIAACSKDSGNANQPEKIPPVAFVKADSFVLITDPEALENTQEIGIVIRNDGRFDGKEVMIVIHNCKNQNGALQGGLGLKVENQRFGESEAMAIKAIFSADQSVATGSYTCEIFASATSGESVSSQLNFEIA